MLNPKVIIQKLIIQIKNFSRCSTRNITRFLYWKSTNDSSTIHILSTISISQRSIVSLQQLIKQNKKKTFFFHQISVHHQHVYMILILQDLVPIVSNLFSINHVQRLLGCDIKSVILKNVDIFASIRCAFCIIIIIFALYHNQFVPFFFVLYYRERIIFSNNDLIINM